METPGIAGRSKGLKFMDDEKLIPGNGPAAEFLTGHGYKISKSTLSKWSAPSANIDTAIEGYWGHLPLRRPSRLLEWARARLRQPAQTSPSKVKLTAAPAADSATAT
jgi:hypothetical protein